MADDPIITNTDNPPPTTTNPEGLSASEVKGIVGEAVDEKLRSFGGQFATKDDMAQFRAGILEDITQKIPELIPTSKGIDENNLLSKVGGMLDEKLRSVGVRTQRTPGALGRWLQGNG